MHARFEAGAYSNWDALRADLDTMFSNAMTFNAPTTVYHKQARRLALAWQGRIWSRRPRAWIGTAKLLLGACTPFQGNMPRAARREPVTGCRCRCS